MSIPRERFKDVYDLMVLLDLGYDRTLIREWGSGVRKLQGRS